MPVKISTSKRHSDRLWNIPSQIMAGESNYFPSSKYRTCCGCHIRKCAFIIGMLEAIALVAAVVATGLVYVLIWQNGDETLPLHHHASLSLIGSGVALVLGGLAIGLLFFGLAKQRSAFLIPHMAVQFLAIVALLAAIVVFVFIAAVAAEESATNAIQKWSGKKSNATTVSTPQPEKKTWTHLGPGKMFVYSVVVSSFCLLATALEIYFLVVIYRAYAYFSAKREDLKRQAGPVKLWSTNSSFGPADDPAVAARIWYED